MYQDINGMFHKKDKTDWNKIIRRQIQFENVQNYVHTIENCCIQLIVFICVLRFAHKSPSSLSPLPLPIDPSISMKLISI